MSESKRGQWRVQVGKDRGAYRDRYSFSKDEGNRARLWYDGLNVHSGYKKRLVTPDGKVAAREIT